MTERREVCQMQRDFCEKEFAAIKKKRKEDGDKIENIGKIVENGLKHRMQRLEIYLLAVITGLVGLGFFFWRIIIGVVA